MHITLFKSFFPASKIPENFCDRLESRKNPENFPFSKFNGVFLFYYIKSRPLISNCKLDFIFDTVVSVPMIFRKFGRRAEKIDSGIRPISHVSIFLIFWSDFGQQNILNYFGRNFILN